MAGFEFLGTAGTTGFPHLRGVTAFHDLKVGAKTFVVAVSRTGATVLEQLANGALVPISQMAFTAPFQTGVEPSLALYPASGTPTLALGGGTAGLPQFLQVTPAGVLQTLSSPSGWPTQLGAVSSVEIGNVPHALVLTKGTDSLSIYATQGVTIATQSGQISGGALVAPSVVTAARIAGSSFAIVVDDGGRRITAVNVTQPSMPTVTDRLGTADGVGVSGLSTLATVTILGQVFVIAAGSLSSTLTVLRVSPTGNLTLTDHVIDGLGTRFQSVDALAVRQSGDRVYVLAGGSDDGISAFLLLPDGRLHHLAAVEDTAQSTLQNVSAIRVTEVAGKLEVFAGGEGETGISRFVLDPGPVGVTRLADAQGGTLAGTAAGDVLVGGAGADRIEGGAGNDILVDGGGADTLIGGQGADVFIFDDDDATDTILDFQPGLDRIDLSRIPLVYAPDQVEVQTTSSGAILRIRDEILILQSSSGAPISAVDLSGSLVINLDRPIYVPKGEMRSGTPLADILTGTAGDDTFLGGGGNDFLEGLGANDLMDGDSGDDTLMGGTGHDELVGGEGHDVLIGGTMTIPAWISDWLAGQIARYTDWDL